MTSQTPYSPLQTGHFRLLELVTANEADGSSTEGLRFQMREVSLKDFKESTASSRKGPEKEYGWPEVERIRYDFRQLFLQKTDLPGVRKYVDSLGAVEDQSPSTPETAPSKPDLSSHYVALSYCWGPSGSNHAITLNGQRWPVSENLFLVLQQLSQSEAVKRGIRIWTDALSINQSDIAEKEEQIKQMRTIYAKAWQVVIWLGEETPYTKLALNAVRWLAGGHYNDEGAPVKHTTFRKYIPYLSYVQASWSTPANEIKFSEDVYFGLWQLFTRTYWQRLWILQEIALAKANAPIIWGQYCVSLDELKLAAEYISENELALGVKILNDPRVDMPDWVRAYDVTIDREIEFQGKSPSRLWKLSLKMMRLGLLETAHKSQVVNAFDAFALAKSASATNEKDKVFGILGIPNVQELTQVEPNYSQSLTEVYTEFSRRILLAGDLNLLRLTHYAVGDLDDSFHVHRKQKVFPFLPKGWHYYTTFLDSSIAYDNAQNLVSSTLGLHPTKHTIAPCTHSLPSWAVCWSCSSAPTLALPNNVKSASALDTWLFRLWTRKPFSSNRVTCDNGILSVHGIFMDTIVSLSAFHSREDDGRFPCSSNENNKDEDGNISTIREELWGTLVADLGDSPTSDECKVLLLRGLWGAEYAKKNVMTPNPFSLAHFYERNSSLMLCGYSLSELLLDCQECHDAYQDEPETLELVKQVMNRLAWRRLISTEVGGIGLAVAAAEPNDRIAVLVGCDMPMILRQAGEYWQVVGECYLHGMMSGEVADMMIEAGEQLEMIKLK